MTILFEKFKEVLFAVLPITIIVLLLSVTIIPLETHLILRFLVAALVIIFGLSIFLFGVEISVTPIGSMIGKQLVKRNKTWIIAIVGLALGFFISIAEPDLHILAAQVDGVTAGLISKFTVVIVVSLGIAALLSLGLMRIVYNVALRKMLTVLYLLVFVLALFTSSEFLAISFDASGATTGAMTVPFIMALALGVSSLKKGGKASEEDSFGLVAIASAGAIIAVMLMSIISNTKEITESSDSSGIAESSSSVLGPFIETLPTMLYEVFFVLAPLLLIFIIFNGTSFKLSKKASAKILKGLLYSYSGLVLFLTGVNASFIDVGTIVGFNVASLGKDWVLLLVGFILGLAVILAEPAVYILTNQIEIVTSGHIKRGVVMIALSLGVASAVALSMLRIITPGIELWQFLLPGYFISIVLSYFVPNLFVGIGFDSGGVASGPMTATFILSFASGAASAVEGANVLIDGFGVIAMVALMPIIALQVLGLIFRIKSRKGGVESIEQRL